MSRPSSLYGPLYSGASTHAKVQDLSIALDVPMYAAFGIVATIWEKALTQCPTGRWRRWNASTIAKLIEGYEGDPGVLLSALLSAGYLRIDGGDLCIHDWEQYGGASITARDAKVKRTRAWRASQKRDVTETEDVRQHCDVTETSHVLPLGDNTVGDHASLLSSSLLFSDPDQKEIAHPVPASEPARVKAPSQPAARMPEPRRLRAGVTGYPQPESIAALLASPSLSEPGKTIGEEWRGRWESFGKPGALTFDEAVGIPFAHWQKMDRPWAWPHEAVGRFASWMSDLHSKAETAVAASLRTRAAQTYAAKAQGVNDDDAILAASRRSGGRHVPD